MESSCAPFRSGKGGGYSDSKIADVLVVAPTAWSRRPLYPKGRMKPYRSRPLARGGSASIAEQASQVSAEARVTQAWLLDPNRDSRVPAWPAALGRPAWHG